MSKSFRMVRSARKILVEQKKESKKSDPYRAVILSEKPENNEYYHTAGRIKEEAEKLGHEVYVVEFDGAYIKWKDDRRTIKKTRHLY